MQIEDRFEQEKWSTSGCRPFVPGNFRLMRTFSLHFKRLKQKFGVKLKKAAQFSLSNWLEQKLQFHFAKIQFSFCWFLTLSRKSFDDFLSF